MSEELLSEIDLLTDNKNRSEFMRNAAMHYIKLKRRMNMHKELKDGYEKMGDINLDIAKEWEAADLKLLSDYEKKISEN